MRAHAIVIGIDQYANAKWNLTGAVHDATEFARWACESGGVAPENLRLLLSPLRKDAPAGAKRATRDAIVAAIDECMNGGAANADRLWFYYAGHGFSAPIGDTAAAPILVPADVKSLRFDPVELETFRSFMQNRAPKEQFYFIDACRAPLDGMEQILGREVLWDLREAQVPATQVILYAVSAGEKALELHGHGIFTRALLQGLRGIGPELFPMTPAGSEKPRHELVFESLKEFVDLAVKNSLDGLTDLPPELRNVTPYALIYRVNQRVHIADFELEDLPSISIEAIVEPEKARPQGRVEFLQYSHEVDDFVARRTNPAPAVGPLPDRIPFVARVGKHLVRASSNGFTTVTNPIRVYEEKAFPFDLVESPKAAKPAAEDHVTRGFDFSLAQPLGTLYATCRDPHARLSIVHGRDVLAHGFGEVDAHLLSTGLYTAAAELTASERVEQVVYVEEGQVYRVSLDVATPRSAGIERILRDHGISLDRGYAQLGEGLGDVANIRLGSLLAYGAWAARWPRALRSLHALGVDPLRELTREQSALQVLVGDLVENAPALLARIEIEGEAEAMALAPLPKLRAAQGASIRSHGPMRVRVELAGFAPASFAVALLPGYVTALAIAREADGGVDVQQHLNPIDVTKPAGRGFGPPQPDDVRLVELAWRALEGRDPVSERELEDIRKGQRSNPMLAILAGYRSFLSGDRRFALRSASMLPLVFPALPDAYVLAGLAEPRMRDRHFSNAARAGAPVIADGFRTLFEWGGWQSPALLPGTVWTAFAERPRVVEKLVTPSEAARASRTDDPALY